MKQILQNKLYRLSTLFLLGLISVIGNAQNSATEGTEFYVSFGQNVTSPVCQIRYVVTETCQITAQYGDGTYLKNNITYTPGVYTKAVNMSKCYITGSGISNLTLKVNSTKKNGIFAINMAVATTDATTVLPIDA